MMIDGIISEQFDDFVVFRESIPWLHERRWFRLRDVLGIMIFDEADQDWRFITLAQDGGGLYRGVDLGTSFKTEQDVAAMLEKSMMAHCPGPMPKRVPS